MINIRPSEERDIDRILELQMQLYPSIRRSREWFRWKYCDNPHGKSIFLVAENDNGELIGMRGLWPRRYRFGATLYTAYQPTDTGVRADYRGKGLFKSLTTGALRLAVVNNCSLVFNFPNKASLPGYLRLGWTQEARIHWWVQPFPISFSRAHITTVDHDDNPPVVNRRLHLIKDPDYVEWRYRRHPYNTYRFFDLGSVRGEHVYAVVTRVKRKGISQELLVDVVGTEEASVEFSEMIGPIVKQVAGFGYLFTILESTFDYSSTLLLHHGFIRLPKVGVNFVAYNPALDANPVSVIELSICPGDMDTF